MKQAITVTALSLAAATSSRSKVDNSLSLSYGTTTSLSLDGINVLYRGGETLVTGRDTTNQELKIYYQSLSDSDLDGVYVNALYSSDTYVLTPADTSTPSVDENFPNAVALSPVDDLNRIFVSSSADSNQGRVAVYEGKYTSWSLQQFLSPSEEYLDVADYFGQQIAFDSNNYDTLYVGCANCSSVNSKRHGSIYLYKQGKNGNKAWSQAQQIYFPNVYNLGWEGLKVKGDLLLADISNLPRDVDPAPADYVSSTVVLRKDAGGNFRPEQILSVKTTDINDFDVEDNTIVLAAKGQSYKALNGAGAVYVLTPATLPPPAPGKPRPIQWSVQQVLFAKIPADSENFGVALDLDGDRLSVQSGNAQSNYVFEKSSNGKWSLQQTLSLQDDGGANVFLSEGSLISLTKTTIDIFDEFQNDECLVVSMEDQFGDGWDVAKLVVTRPDGTKDYLVNHCDTENPHQVRYCPRDSSDAGVYRFALVDTQKASNSWEIIWRVLNEKTGDWVYGDVSTKLEYEWDATYGFFTDRKVEKALPNTTCVDCPIRPTDKPTPLLRRLKGGDSNTNGHSTHHPTHTPAPTIETSPGPYNWRKLTLSSPTPWYESEYRAAYYYVTDTKNRRLITKGTFCDTGLTTKDCWLDLPDGEYNIRVGGALLRIGSGDLTWTYCNSVNSFHGQEQVTVKIEDDNCIAYAQHNNHAFCNRADAVSIVELDFMVMGASASDSLSSNDRQILAQAIAFAIDGVSAEDVSVLSAVQSGYGTYLVTANVGFRHSTTGYDTLTVDGINKLVSSLETYMSGEGPRNIWAGLQAAQHSNIFHTSTSVQFISAKVVGSKDIVPSGSVEEVVTFSDSVTVSYSQDTKSSGSGLSSVLESISYGGYAVAGVFVALVVGLFVSNRKKEQSALPVSQEDPVMDSSKRVQLKDLNLVAPSVSDLKQLVKAEDEVLNMMLNRP